jgi:hypothetical protein
MAKPDPISSPFQQEASSVSTSPQRLQELFEADPSLGVVIASNPSASIQMLDQLASQYPAEVLANPLVQLGSLEVGRVFGAFSLKSLVCLSLVDDSQIDTQLVNETRCRLNDTLDQLCSQEFVGLSCIWLWQRTFTLQPDDCAGLIGHDLELSLESRAFVDGDTADICSAIPQLACEDPDLAQGQRARLATFLRAIDNGSLNSYLDSQIDFDGDREHKGASDILLTILGAAGRYSTEGSLLIQDDEPILAFHALTNEFESISYEDGVVRLAIGEHEEVEREYHLSLGELQQLRALAEQRGHVPDDWHERLARLLIPD